MNLMGQRYSEHGGRAHLGGTVAVWVSPDPRSPHRSCAPSCQTRFAGREPGHEAQSCSSTARSLERPVVGGSPDIPDFATTAANGSWSFTGTIPCDFGDGAFVGQFIEDVIATDAEGASAAGHLTANCV